MEGLDLDEKAYLEDEKQALEEEMKAVQARIDELK